MFVLTQKLMLFFVVVVVVQFDASYIHFSPQHLLLISSINLYDQSPTFYSMASSIL